MNFEDAKNEFETFSKLNNQYEETAKLLRELTHERNKAYKNSMETALKKLGYSDVDICYKPENVIGRLRLQEISSGYGYALRFFPYTKAGEISLKPSFVSAMPYYDFMFNDETSYKQFLTDFEVVKKVTVS